jgi:SAM-dependent methyltransferase
MRCRFCKSQVDIVLVDLGFAPPSNAFLNKEDMSRPEIYYPLRVKVCESCWLVQTEDYAKESELFNSEYVYFSSVSSGWVEHARKYSEEMIDKYELSKSSLVIEIACNDGYLLKNFIKKNIPCLGVEPTGSTAKIAKSLGITLVQDFFTKNLAEKISINQKADLVIANNVLAHVPDINDFCSGVGIVLKHDGVATFEFPHLLNLIKLCQFDTIYHEHYSYLSLYAVKKIFEANGLYIFDVQKIGTHGGSLRVYACPAIAQREATSAIDEILAEEEILGLNALKIYQDFQSRVAGLKNQLLKFLIDSRLAGKLVVGYGAAAKGNTLLNFAGIKEDLLPYICDESIYKQNKMLPGSHIPVYSPEKLAARPPDYLLIFPWNIKSEIIEKYSFLKKSGTKFVTFEPDYIEI